MKIASSYHIDHLEEQKTFLMSYDKPYPYCYLFGNVFFNLFFYYSLLRGPRGESQKDLA